MVIEVDNKKTGQKRWYDEEPAVANAIDAWEKFPRALQIILANYINDMVQEQKQSHRLTGTYDKVSRFDSKQLLGMYQATLKRRWHDQDPILRKALNSLMFIEMDELMRFSQRVLKLEAFLKAQELESHNLSEDDLADLLSDILDHLEQTSITEA